MQFATLLLALLPSVHAINVLWNSPWPTQCGANFTAPPNAITRFNVTSNKGGSFNGAAVSTLYNSPDRMTLGLWPCYTANGSAINGGLPQLGDLTAHLAKVRRDAAALPTSGGAFVIDWEVWTPWLLPSASSLYFNKSVELAGGDVGQAIADWNASSLHFMVETLRVAREVRPEATWGYFGMVQCTFDVTTEECAPAFTRINDALTPLWAASDALFPEFYATCPIVPNAPADVAGAAAAGHRCDSSAKLPLKIASRLAEATRVAGSHHQQTARIIPFTWYALDDGKCTRRGEHCPLITTASDLRTEFLTAALGAKVNAVIVWGSSADVASTKLCEAFGAYLNSTLGPVLQALAAK